VTSGLPSAAISKSKATGLAIVEAEMVGGQREQEEDLSLVGGLKTSFVRFEIAG